MVGRSNEISREICRVQDADEASSRMAVGDAADQWPRPRGAVSQADGERTRRYRRPRMKRPDRSQSSHTSDEAVQQNAVEQRGTGKEMQYVQATEP